MASSNERTEREFQLDVNQAVANTESEIFGDALGDEPLDNDADTSLEEMGEGLEGDDLDEEEGAEEDGDEEEGAENDAGEDAETPEEGEDAEDADGDDRSENLGHFERGKGFQPTQDRRHIPLRQERERRRAVESENADLRRQMAEMNGRLTEISARVNAPVPKPETVEKKQKPDMFADPEGYERWVMEEAEKKADAKIEQRFTDFREQQRQEREDRLNDNLQRAASGERGFEFRAAYDAIMALDPRDPANQTTVQRLINAADTGQAILDWFEDNGAEDFRTNIARSLGLLPSRNAARPQSRERLPARHETRLPEQLRRPQPPSLNATRGGQRQQASDPEMMDDTDEGVFRFATRR